MDEVMPTDFYAIATAAMHALFHFARDLFEMGRFSSVAFCNQAAKGDVRKFGTCSFWARHKQEAVACCVIGEVVRNLEARSPRPQNCSIITVLATGGLQAGGPS